MGLNFDVNTVKITHGDTVVELQGSFTGTLEELFGQSGGHVVFTDYGDKKIMCIKITREWLGIGLKDAKDLVESVDNGPLSLPASRFGSEEKARQFANRICEYGGHAVFAGDYSPSPLVDHLRNLLGW